MKNLSTGTGLALLATAIVAYPIVNRISSVDQTAHASVPVAAIAAAATAQANPEPTIVWYGTGSVWVNGSYWPVVYRAWSNGRVEMAFGFYNSYGSPAGTCYSYLSARACDGQQWFVISDPNQGYNAAADINFDAKVDGADLATMLADWGDAPRYDIPPSDCPLNLINP